MTDRLSQRPVPPLDPPQVFAGGEVVAAVRCPVDMSTYPRRHVIVVKHAGDRQTFSVHEVAHNHTEWVGGQGHYDLGYADAVRLMAGKTLAHDGARLSGLPAHVRNHPMFRRGYDLGYSDRPRDERPAGTRPRPPGSEPSGGPASYSVDAGGLRDRLQPGVRVLREVPALADRAFTAEVPCCGRPVTVPVPDGEAASSALCCRCGVTYSATCAEEEPDGYADEPMMVAVFTVEHVRAAVARHRSGRWEQVLSPQRPGDRPLPR